MVKVWQGARSRTALVYSISTTKDLRERNTIMSPTRSAKSTFESGQARFYKNRIRYVTGLGLVSRENTVFVHASDAHADALSYASFHVVVLWNVSPKNHNASCSVSMAAKCART